MTIEKKLTELQALEVGNVERAIEGIEKSKLRLEKTHSIISEELELYKRTLSEKLPIIIGNIATMGRFIVELGHGSSSHISVHQEGKIHILRRGIPQPNYHDSNSFGMIFDNSGNVHGINFGSSPYWDRKHWYSLRHSIMQTPIIQSGRPDDFTSKYIDIVIQNLERSGDSEYILLPSILNNVPEEIMLIYEQRKRDVEGRLNTIKQRNGELDSLEASDLT